MFDLVKILRFAAVGLLNTALGYSVILAGLAFGYGDILSNAMGYAAGLILGFILNNRWTFSSADHFRRGMLSRYALSFAVAYGANLAIVFTALSFGFTENAWVHLAGICVYSGLFYLASACFVFTDQPAKSVSAKTRF